MSQLLLFISSSFLILAYPFGGSMLAIWLLVFSQLCLLYREIQAKQVSGVGGFVFMSFLFFAIRPLYIVYENDYLLFTNLFLIRVNLSEISDAMWWATFGLIAFLYGSLLAPTLHKTWRKRRFIKNCHKASSPASVNSSGLIIILQLLSVPLMVLIASAGRSLYGNAIGAYIYDFPIPVQALNVFSVVVIFDYMLRRPSLTSVAKFVISLSLFLYVTWLMREISMFRGFYLLGVMICVVALLQRLKSKVSIVFLILPIVVFQPFFQYLGEARNLQNDAVKSTFSIDSVYNDQSFLQAYWNFYDSRGDMNIFDTFIAAKLSNPNTRPYILSWLYAPLHVIPRTLWKQKPQQGTLQDVSFTNGAPYCPGIIGYFLLDGGLFWMLMSMFFLGYLVSLLDLYVLSMTKNPVYFCFTGITVVNGMFLARSFLWFYLWQSIYALIPIIVLSKLFLERRSVSTRLGS